MPTFVGACLAPGICVGTRGRRRRLTRCAPSLSARSIIRAALLLADDEDFQDQLRKLDGAAAKLQGMLIKMDKGECSPLDAEPPLKNFKRKLQSFAVEVTDLDADILKTSYPSKSLGGKHNPKSLHKKFKELERSSADRVERAKKGDLKRGAAAQFDKEGASAGQMLEEAQRIQGKDMDAVKRMQRQIDQTEQVAASTMETMKDQTEQIGKIHQDLEEIDDTLKMAGQELTRYARRLATDKVILAFIGLIVIGIFVIIILSSVGAVDETQVNAPDIIPDVDLNGRRRLLLARPAGGGGAP